MSARTRVRKQIRGFVIVWTVVTLLMGVCTFVAIFQVFGTLTASPLNNARSNAALPAANTPVQRAVVQVSTSTPFPTRAPLQAVTATPTEQVEEVEQVEQAQEEAAPGSTPLPVDVDHFELGVQVQVSFDLMDVWISEASNHLGVPWVKQQVRWEDIEPERGQYDWGPLDIYFDSAAKHNVKVLASVVTAPAWAREAGVDTSRHGPPADFADYAGFVQAIVERYQGKVHAIEVWNEMNLDREWTSTGGISAQNYVAMLRTTFETIKEIDPGIIVVSGALSPTGFDDGRTARDDAVFMDELIAAGMLNYADCVGAHHNGYNVSPNFTYDAIPNDPTALFRGPFDNPHRSWSFRSTLQAYALKIANAGSDLKLCVTEFGWPSSEGIGGYPQGFEFAQDNTLEEQAEYFVDALNNMVEWDIVRLAFVWNLNYGPQAGYSAENDNVPYSLIGPETSFRPAFDAIKEWAADYEESLN